MVKMLIDLSEEEDGIVEVYKLVNKNKTKQEAIKDIIRYFKVNIRPRNLDKNEKYYKRSLQF